MYGDVIREIKMPNYMGEINDQISVTACVQKDTDEDHMLVITVTNTRFSTKDPERFITHFGTRTFSDEQVDWLAMVVGNKIGTAMAIAIKNTNRNLKNKTQDLFEALGVGIQ